MKRLHELCEDLARLSGELETGIPGAVLQAGKFSVAKLAVFESGYFNEWHGRFVDGPQKNTSFVVTDFTADLGELYGLVDFVPKLASDDSVKVTATDHFYLSQTTSPEDLIMFVNQAIEMVANEALSGIVNDSIEILTDVYEYAIPTSISYIEELYQEQGTSGRYDKRDRFDHRHWGMLAGGKLWFSRENASLNNGRHIRIIGQESPKALTDDKDVTNVNPTFVTYQALALWHLSKIRGIGTDFNEHTTQMQLNQTLANTERARMLRSGIGQEVIR